MAYFQKINGLLNPRQSDILDPNIQQAQQEGQAQQGQQGGTIKTSADVLTTADSGASGAPQQANQVKQSTFTNPTAIIDANKGQASLDITSGSNKSIADAQAKLAQDARSFKENAKAAMNVPQLTDAEIEDGITNKPQNITGALNKKAMKLQNFDPLNTAEGDVDYLASQEGRDSLMRKAGGANYNQGMLGLDRALTGYDASYLSNIQKTQEANGGLNKGIADEKVNYVKANEDVVKDVDAKREALRLKLDQKMEGSAKSSESAKLQTQLENDQRKYLRDMFTRPERGTDEYDEATKMAQAYADVAKEGLVKADPSLAEYATAGVVDPRKFITVNADVSEDDYRTEGEATRFNKIAELLGKGDRKSAGKAISQPVVFDAVAYGNEVQRMKRYLNPGLPAGDTYVQDPNGNWVKK